MGEAAAVVSAIVAVYGAYQQYRAGSGGGPPQPTSGPPANYRTYGSDGQITGENIWNAGTNSYEYRTYEYGKKPAAPKAPQSNKFSVYIADPNGPDIVWHPGMMVDPYLDHMMHGLLTERQKAYDAAMAKYNDAKATLPDKIKEWETRKAEYEKEQQTTKDILKNEYANINLTDEERWKKYEDAAVAFSEQQHAQLDPQMEQAQRAEDQRTADRGMTGSRADVDTQAVLEKTKSEANAEVARNSTMYKYALGDADLQRSLGTIGVIKGGETSDMAMALQRQSLAAQATIQANQGSIARDTANNNSAYLNWLAKYQQKMAFGQGLTNTASGLAYLYGYSKKNSSGNSDPSLWV